MPKLVDPAAQRREICRAARGVFQKRGLAGTGLEHVARAAGMGRSSLYHYFPDKDALLRELVKDQLAEEEALFRAAVTGAGSPLARIEQLMEAQVDLFPSWRETASLTVEMWSGHGRSFRPFFRRIRAGLARLIEEGQQLGEIDAKLDPTHTAAALVATIDGLLLQYIVDPAVFPISRPGDVDTWRRTLVASARKQLAP